MSQIFDKIESGERLQVSTPTDILHTPHTTQIKMLQKNEAITFDALVNAIKNTPVGDEMKQHSEWYEIVKYLTDNADELRQIYDNHIIDLIDHLMAEGFEIGIGWVGNTYEELEEDLQ